jgi:hypothetical protein
MGMAFAGEPGGCSRPQRHGRWTAIGVVPPEKDPSFKLSRKVIKSAINRVGFRLWRLGKNKEAKS